MTKEQRKDFKNALAKLQEFYIAFWQTDTLSVADKESMHSLLSKPYIRKMLKDQQYYTDDPKGLRKALLSLEESQ